MCEPIAEHELAQAEVVLQQRLRGRAWELRILVREGGVILQGQALDFYAKQLSQHIAMQELRLTIVANEIEVRPALPAPNTGGDPE